MPESEAAAEAPAAIAGDRPRLGLSAEQQAARLAFREFVRARIAPFAGDWDRQRRLPPEVIGELRDRGWLGAPLPREAGGAGMDPITYGLLTEEIGRGCSSVRSLLTVHDMVGLAVARWGRPELRRELVPRIARAELLCALALSEPGVGSDAAAVETEARADGDGWRLYGRKRWVTFGRIADLLLVVARAPEGPIALLVDAVGPGLERRPMDGVVGTRASLLAEIDLDGCRVPGGRLLARPGLGFSHVATTALDHGRYSVAWGAVGIAQACLDASLDYAAGRRQGGVAIAEHQLVQRKLTEMIVNVRAARLLCLRAGWLRSTRDPWALNETMVAKYFASRAATRAANDAVQLHGGNGLSEGYPVERYLRDARVTEVIEGSTQIQQIAIARHPPPEL